MKKEKLFGRLLRKILENEKENNYSTNLVFYRTVIC